MDIEFCGLMFFETGDGRCIAYRSPARAFAKLGWSNDARALRDRTKFAQIKLGKAMALLAALGSHPNTRRIAMEMADHAVTIQPQLSQVRQLVESIIQSCDGDNFALKLQDKSIVYPENGKKHFIKFCNELRRERLQYVHYFIAYNDELGEHIERQYGRGIKAYLEAMRENPFAKINHDEIDFLRESEKPPKTFDGIAYKFIDRSRCEPYKIGHDARNFKT